MSFGLLNTRLLLRLSSLGRCRLANRPKLPLELAELFEVAELGEELNSQEEVQGQASSSIQSDMSSHVSSFTERLIILSMRFASTPSARMV